MKSFGCYTNIFAYNMLILNNIMRGPSNLPVDGRGLTGGISADKVLHINRAINLRCNTLSEVRLDIHHPTKPTPCFPFYQTPMLDDPAAGCRDALLHPLCPTLSVRGRILQQLHSQWWMVHPSFDPSIRTR